MSEHNSQQPDPSSGEEGSNLAKRVPKFTKEEIEEKKRKALQKRQEDESDESIPRASDAFSARTKKEATPADMVTDDLVVQETKKRTMKEEFLFFLSKLFGGKKQSETSTPKEEPVMQQEVVTTESKDDVATEKVKTNRVPHTAETVNDKETFLEHFVKELRMKKNFAGVFALLLVTGLGFAAFWSTSKDSEATNNPPPPILTEATVAKIVSESEIRIIKEVQGVGAAVLSNGGKIDTVGKKVDVIDKKIDNVDQKVTALGECCKSHHSTKKPAKPAPQKQAIVTPPQKAQEQVSPHEPSPVKEVPIVSAATPAETSTVSSPISDDMKVVVETIKHQKVVKKEIKIGEALCILFIKGGQYSNGQPYKVAVRDSEEACDSWEREQRSMIRN